MSTIWLILLMLFFVLATYSGINGYIRSYNQNNKGISQADWNQKRKSSAPYVGGILAIYILSLIVIINALGQVSNTYMIVTIYLAILGNLILITFCLIFLLARHKPKLPKIMAKNTYLIFSVSNLSVALCLFGLIILRI